MTDNESTRALMATIDRLVAERDAAERRAEKAEALADWRLERLTVAIAQSSDAETERDVYASRIAEIADDMLGVQPVASSSIALLNAIEARHTHVYVILAAAERRESELGLQVVAQAARLRLADGLAASVRCFLLGCDDQMSSPPPSLDAALAAWDAVPGDQG